MTRPDKVVVVAGSGRIDPDLFAVGGELTLKGMGTFVVVDRPVEPQGIAAEDLIKAIRSPDGETHYVKKIGRNRAERRSLQRNRRNGV